ncbi:MAG TPA: cytochrome c oxidase subunit II [Gaiellales bacterium]
MLAISAHDTAGQFAGLWHIYLGVTVAVGVVVTGAIVVAVVRFRRRNGRAPRDLRSAPRLEAAYLAVIVVIVIGLLAFTYRTENNEDALVAHPAVRVDVIASQWQWLFRYPASGIVMTARNIGSQHPRFARLVVPAGRPVEFWLRSADVLHSFFIPAMRFKRYAFENATNRFVLTFPHPGRMLGECAQLCGWDHAEMRFTVIVLSPAHFQAWVAAHAPAAAG